jgi:hypothetical protein
VCRCKAKYFLYIISFNSAPRNKLTSSFKGEKTESQVKNFVLGCMTHE